VELRIAARGLTCLPQAGSRHAGGKNSQRGQTV